MNTVDDNGTETPVPSFDPRTGSVVEQVATATSTGQVDRLVRQAHTAAEPLRRMGRLGRADLLDELATALEGRRADIVSLADRETAIGTDRLEGELTRTTNQMVFFAEVLREGSYLEATIDHAAGTAPDLRRMLVPLGPVAVFGASNFPLAFSVPGGDTVSAMAAGSPVVVKAHQSHPGLSELVFDVLNSALHAAGAPEGTLALVHGRAAAEALVAHPRIKAVGFTGSLGGAQALIDVINQRDEPIPFFGELSSGNPVIVTRAAAAARGTQIAQGLFSSFTTGAGQLCTKPGVVFVPQGEEGDALVQKMARQVTGSVAHTLLNKRIHESYDSTTHELTHHKAITELAVGSVRTGEGYGVETRLLSLAADDVDEHTTRECFGPVTLIARYKDNDDLEAAFSRLGGSLTATLHSEPTEYENRSALSGALAAFAGRIVYDGYPTGVAVTWGQHHGGPWPSTNTQHTSVGATAIRRFLRPLVWQNAPHDALPEELREETLGFPRRVDGVLRFS